MLATFNLCNKLIDIGKGAIVNANIDLYLANNRLTEEELEVDRAARPEPIIPPTNAELAEENKLLKQQVSALTDQQSFYEDCIAEMAEVVYA